MWIVVNIGCIECGVSSNIVGLFDDEERAKHVAETLDKEMGWREGGQNSYEVFPQPAVNVIAEEYRTALMTIAGDASAPALADR
jgi:D-serine deaminase-like pyridoxal phosphate-dependent protein